MRENRRAIMSRRIIKSTLIEMLEKEPLSNITVTRLCNTADINRSTFYAHFVDIFEVLEDIEEDFIQKISFSRMSVRARITLETVRNLVSYIDKHRDAFLILLENGYLKSKGVEEWTTVLATKASGDENYIQEIIKITYSFYGTIETLKRWVTGEFKIPFQELTVLLYQMLSGNVGNL